MRAPHYALANGLLDLGSAGVAWPQPHAQVQLRGLRSGGSECTVAPHCAVLQCAAAHTAPRVLHAAPRRATVVCAVAAALLSTQGKPRGRAMRACTAGRRPPSRRVYEKRHGVRVRVRVCVCVQRRRGGGEGHRDHSDGLRGARVLGGPDDRVPVVGVPNPVRSPRLPSAAGARVTSRGQVACTSP